MPAHYATVSTLVLSDASSIYEAFVDPKKINKFWLRRSAGPLHVGEPVRWEFLVPGASAITTASALHSPSLIVFTWSDGVSVRIDIEERTRTSAVVRVKAGPFSSTAKAVGATEGFSIVLSDLKVWLESGKSPNLVRDKAKLIARS